LFVPLSSFFVLLHCVSFLQQPKEKGQKDTQCKSPKKEDKGTNNTTAQRKRTKGQTMQKPKERGQRDKQYVLFL
jgi:hypothetical protein